MNNINNIKINFQGKIISEKNIFIEDGVENLKKKKMIKDTKIDSNLNILVDEENILFFSVRNAFKGNKSIKIYFNTLLFNIFESNIVLKVFIKNKKNKKIEFFNIIQ